jgi:hypothetical protein
MPDIEPWLRFCLVAPAVAPFMTCTRWADVLKVLMNFSELERPGWIAILWLMTNALWKVATKSIGS